MILKEIYLYPDLVEFQSETTNLFRYQSRFVCNYLERSLKTLKFKVEGFKRICFIGKSNPSDFTYINSSKVLIIEVQYTEDKFIKLSDLEKSLFFCELLESGLVKACKFHELPVDILLLELNQFKSNGFINEWTFKSKRNTKVDLKYSLLCSIDIDAFHLFLLIEKGKKNIFYKEILQTEPDELIYSYLFKDVSFEQGSVVVVDKFGKSFFEIDINKIDIEGNSKT